eukprot:CAMPEP_0194042392 /NCGR_PEP_ID=MMETSP0009_2-20130614/14171_1 /TAXON_ID=210454 /ORGANISM="Grammatophora oceanica, Strain CCMP 410" /LENGTH=63 /DNA_ID=CAMNT_0038686223 /DNA_START=336 /DNA_END=524 /DNA_ORIENTATION=+
MERLNDDLVMGALGWLGINDLCSVASVNKRLNGIVMHPANDQLIWGPMIEIAISDPRGCIPAC